MYQMFVIASSQIPPQKKVTLTHRRRALEKARIQKLKLWHDDVKKIARSEIDFIASIFKEDDKDPQNRDWVRDDEEDWSDEEGDGKLVETKP